MKKIIVMFLSLFMLMNYSMGKTIVYGDGEDSYNAITEVEATSDIVVPTYGDSMPSSYEFTITKGDSVTAPSTMRKWWKYDDSQSEWLQYKEAVFTEGKYYYKVQLRTDTLADRLTEDTTLTVDGVEWEKIGCSLFYTDDSKFGFMHFKSPEYNVEKVNYTITYNLNSGINNPSNATFYNVLSDDIILLEPTRDGCYFDGWYLEDTYENKIEKIPSGSTGDKVLYAKWIYKINFHNVDGLDNPNATSFVDGETITLSNVSKDGYTFKGWYKEDTLKTKVTKINKSNANDDGDINLYAKWVPIQYTITYVLNGGKNNSANKTKYNIETGISLYDPMIRKGYSFEGWYDNPNFDGSKLTSISVGTFGNKTLYAKWIPNIYTITFDAGEFGDPDYIGGKYEYTIETDTFNLRSAKWAGNTFIGWYEVKDGKETKVTTIKKGTARDYELSAKYKEGIVDYFIAFDGSGATKGKMSTITKKDGKSLTLTKNSFVKNGYTFIGWSMIPNDSTAYYSDKEVLSADTYWTSYGGLTITLYAVWQPTEYTITYENYDNTGLENVATYNIEDDNISLNPVHKEGYDFAGWYLDKSFKKPVGEIAIATGSFGNKTFYAKFVPHNYTIAFDANGGSGTMKQIKTKVGSTATLTNNTFKYNGKVFDSWNTEADGSGTTYTNKQKVKDLSLEEGTVVTLYAQYRPYIYNITFNANGGKGKMNKQQGYDEISTTLSKNSFTRVGYTFAGWNTVAKPTTSKPGVFYADEAEAAIDATKDKQSITLYAQWTPITYTIEFNINTDNPNAAGQMLNMENVTYDISTKLNKCDYYRTDGEATFAGWSLTPNGPVKYKDGASIRNLTSINNGKVVLYAKYNYKNTYKINYVLDGGTNSKENIKTYNVDTDFTFKAPSKKGYIFKGWYDSSLNEVTKISPNTSGNKTLYATWYSTSKDMADYVIENGEVYENQKYICYSEIEDERYNYWFIVYDDNPDMLQFWMEFKDTNKFMSMSFDLDTYTMKTSNFGFYYGTSPSNYTEVGYATLNASAFTKKTKLNFTIWNYNTGKNESGTTKTLYSNYGNEMLQHMVSMFDDILGDFYNIVCGEEVFYSMYDMGFYSYK